MGQNLSCVGNLPQKKSKYERILLASEIVKAIINRRVCAKFDVNM